MFKRINIEMTEPLCPCKAQNLSWGINSNSGRPGMFIRCETCGTMLTVPHKHFVASFDLDEPYPNDCENEDDEDGPKLEVLDGGKVLKFDTSDSDKGA